MYRQSQCFLWNLQSFTTKRQKMSRSMVLSISRKDDKTTKLLTVVMSGERDLESFLSGFKLDAYDLCV